MSAAAWPTDDQESLHQLDELLEAFSSDADPTTLLAWLDDDNDRDASPLQSNGLSPAVAEDALPPPSSVMRSPSVPPGFNATATRRRQRRPHPSASDTNKVALDELRIEVQQLSTSLDRLLERHFGSRQVSSAEADAAFMERRKRHRAERECEQLRQAVFTHAAFIRNIRAMFTAPVSSLADLNLCRYLHRFTRLPRLRSVRWVEYAALSHASRLYTAKDLVVRETAFIARGAEIEPSAAAPHIQTNLLLDGHGCGVTTLSVYALDTRDVGAVVRGVCVAVADIVSKCLAYKTVELSRTIVDPDASGSERNHFLYGVTGFQHKSVSTQDSASSNTPQDHLQIESRVLTQYKQLEGDEEAVVMWDFVDEDELYPTDASIDITRQSVGVCLIKRELCDDGVERVVYRSFSTRLYRFHRDPVQAAFQRFTRITEDAMKTHELLFRGIIAEQVVAEAATCMRAAQLMRSATS